MKKIQMRSLQFVLVVLMMSIAFQGCKKEEVVDPTVPNGDFTVSKSGTFVNENSSGTAGQAQLGTDEDGTQFMKFGSDFTTNLATGTAVVYLSTSAVYTASPSTGNPDIRLIGSISKAGLQYFRIDPKADAKFTHVIVYCASAGVQFGNAPLN